MFDFASLCQMHYRIFRDIYEWAGKPRIINIEKAEEALNGISVEYSDVFDIERDAKAVLADMNLYGWKKASLDEAARRFSDFMAELWKSHPFREGNTRTVVTFCAIFIEEQGIYIDSELFKDNAKYMRDALVAASAVFSDLGDRRKPEYLYRIVEDALERGKEIKEDAVRRIKEAGFPAGEEQVRKVIFWDRKERRPHSGEEIQRFLKEKKKGSPRNGKIKEYKTGRTHLNTAFRCVFYWIIFKRGQLGTETAKNIEIDKRDLDESNRSRQQVSDPEGSAEAPLPGFSAYGE